MFPSISSSSGSAAARATASKAQAALSSVYQNSARRAMGDAALDAIAADVDATDIEKAVAVTARSLSAKGCSDSLASAAHGASLRVLAQGVGGPVGPALASLALSTVSNIYGQADGLKAASTILQVVQTHGEVLEKQLAATALRASSSVSSTSAGLAVSRVALEMIARGVGGAAGPVLARLATQSLSAIYASEDGRRISASVLNDLQAHGSAVESQVAKGVLSSVSSDVSARTAAFVQQSALDRIARTLKGEPEIALLSILTHAHTAIYSSAEKRAVGARIFSEISPDRTAFPEVARAAGAMGRAPISDSSASAIYEQAAKVLVSDLRRDAYVELVVLGRVVRRGVYGSREQHLLTQPLLEVLGQNSLPAVAALAEVTRGAAGLNLGATSLVTFEEKALEQMTAHPSDPPERCIARLGLDTLSALYSTDDQRKLGNHLLRELRQRATTADFVTMLDWVCSPGQQLTVADLRTLLQSIADGQCALPDLSITVGADTFRVAIPPRDEGQEPSAYRGSLESSVRTNQEVLRQAEKLVDAATTQLAPLHKRQIELLGVVSGRVTSAPLGAPMPPPRRPWLNADVLHRCGLGAVVGGVAALALGHHGLGAVVMMGGIGSMVLSSLLVSHRVGSARAQSPRLQALEELERLSNEISPLEKRRDEAQRVGANATRAIKMTEGPLELLRMADSVNKPVVADRTLTLEDTSLVIGGLRVPRRVTSDHAQRTPVQR